MYLKYILCIQINFSHEDSQRTQNNFHDIKLLKMIKREGLSSETFPHNLNKSIFQIGLYNQFNSLPLTLAILFFQ